MKAFFKRLNEALFSTEGELAYRITLTAFWAGATISTTTWFWCVYMSVTILSSVSLYQSLKTYKKEIIKGIEDKNER